MSHDKRIHWLVCYDISDPRRLIRVHRCLKKEGVPVQYSVFMLHATRGCMARVLAKLDAIIEPDGDDVRAYPVPEQPWKVTIGADLIPADLWIMES
ncbi:CRISPR-associated endonuclease Cas2 [Malikia spinosa]|uniref:CRISPR-associated endonuclease Cas2 n=1 Tax=Malikia spinosa TaxID=86180 RepID=UPI003FA3007E